MSSGENGEKKPDSELPVNISHMRRNPEKGEEPGDNAAETGDSDIRKEVDVDSGGDGLSDEETRCDDSTLRRIKAAGENISSIYSLHIPKDVETMLWAMSFFLFFAIFIAYIYFMDRVSPWILIPLLLIPVVFWLVVTFAAYWTETRAYYLIKRTLNYDVIQTLRGYRQYVIRRKER